MFGLIIDGWSKASKHYVAVFATFCTEHNIRTSRKTILIAFCELDGADMLAGNRDIDSEQHDVVLQFDLGAPLEQPPNPEEAVFGAARHKTFLLVVLRSYAVTLAHTHTLLAIY